MDACGADSSSGKTSSVSVPSGAPSLQWFQGTTGLSDLWVEDLQPPSVGAPPRHRILSGVSTEMSHGPL